MEEKEKIELSSKEGAIVIRENLEPEIYTPSESGGVYDNVRFTLAFILYAMEQADWVIHFSEFVDSIENKVKIEDKKEEEAENRRSKFKVIDGDKK
tara:strand:+ start:193 stop:480 length:288 start_codon:yes stop_codon:yes gene_type:complete